MNRCLCLLFIILAVSVPAAAAGGESASGTKPLDISAELTAMLSCQIDLEYNFYGSAGIKAGGGICLMNPANITYSLLFVYHLEPLFDCFSLDLEAGMPLAYVNFLEGAVVDWDEIITAPFAGWTFGGGILASILLDEYLSVGLRLHAAAHIEHSDESGWKGPRFMPIWAVVFDF